MKPDPLVVEWIIKAKADLKAALALSRRPKDRFLDQIGFFCQQSVEKLLKAYILARGVSPPRTHDLAELSDMASSLDTALSPISDWSKGLTEFAVEFRYPGASASMREAQDALKRAQKFINIS